MRCPTCSHDDTKVLESRISHEGRAVRRRRKCQACGHRYTTYEKEEMFVFSVRKKDERVEPYSRDKVFRAIQTACQKRPVTIDQIDGMISKMEKTISERGERTVESQKLGDIVMEALHRLDPVAYVRFASVYKDFKDPQEFMREIKRLSDEPGSSHRPE